MTTPGPYPSGVDPVHILAICAEAAPGHQHDTAILAGGRYAACVYLPARRAARAAQAALCRVGYQVDRPTEPAAAGTSSSAAGARERWKPG